MGKILVLIIILFAVGFLWAVPLWVVVNLICLVFNLSFHMTLLQSFIICLLIGMVYSMFFKEEDK